MNFSADALVLVNLIRRKKWEAVLKRLKDVDGDATVKSEHGSLPLHHAAYFDAPFEVIEELVRIDPKSINAKDCDGNLPLHLYLKFSIDQSLEDVELLQNDRNQSLEIVQLLVNDEAVRTANKYGQLPLHVACENKNMKLGVLKALLDNFPEATVAVDQWWGQTPLHMAARELTSKQSDLISELLKRNPGSANIADKYGRYALHLACDNKDFSLRMIKSIVNANPDTLNAKDKMGNLPNPGLWFMELVDIEKNFDTTMQGMTVVAAGAVLENNRLKKSAVNQEPEESAELKKARTRIETLEAKNKDLEQKAKKYQQQVEFMGNSLLALGKSMQNDKSE